MTMIRTVQTKLKRIWWREKKMVMWRKADEVIGVDDRPITWYILSDVSLTGLHLMSKWLWFPPFFFFMIIFSRRSMEQSLQSLLFIIMIFFQIYKNAFLCQRSARIWTCGQKSGPVRPKAMTQTHSVCVCVCDKVVKIILLFLFNLFLLFAARFFPFFSGFFFVVSWLFFQFFFCHTT